MKENNYKPQIPDVMEAIFDAAYLTFDLVAAMLFFIFSKGNMLFILYGILTLTLCGGDAFHLVPRIGCYLPVTLFSKTKPKVGLLMIPKTWAYMWIIVMGLQILSEY